jgi:hypothetical protein
MTIKTFGSVDDRSLEQLKRCMDAGDADYGVLCADHHPGYSQPIGGAIAYEGYVSPSGVGYDIGCIAGGERVLCADGCSRSIERAIEPVCADSTGMLRRVDPFLGVVARGRREVVRLALANGRALTLTPDHRVRTAHAWVRADMLAPGDRVLCPVFVGWASDGDSYDADRVKAAGYGNGRGRAVRWDDASEMVLALSPAARACYMSAFASAEMSTPRLVEGRIPNLAIKQRGVDAIEHVVDVIESLGFEVGVTRSDGENWVAQILGGEAAQVRFIEQVGFNRAADKRLAAANAVAAAWEPAGHVSVRARTDDDARAHGLRRAGAIRRAGCRLCHGTNRSRGDPPRVPARHAPTGARLVPDRDGAWRVRLLGGARRASGG